MFVMGKAPNLTSDAANPGGVTAATATEEREQLLAWLEIAQATGGIGVHNYDIVNKQIEWDARTRVI